MKYEDKIFLQHIIDEISKIEKSSKTLTKEKFEKNVDLQDAMIRRLEVIGEATKNISDKLKKENNSIEWKKIAGTRDVIIHSYFDVDLSLIWVIITDEIPKLKKNIETILNKLNN